jgi:hypothetical protein
MGRLGRSGHDRKMTKPRKVTQPRKMTKPRKVTKPLSVAIKPQLEKIVTYTKLLITLKDLTNRRPNLNHNPYMYIQL